MDETAGMLAARLGLIERIRRIEHVLARGEQARIAAQLMKGYSHELGNQVQIVKLASLELVRRFAPLPPELQELASDLTTSADNVTNVLAQMFAASRPVERDVIGPSVTQVLRAAVELARPAVLPTIELQVELGDSVQTYASGDELEAMVLSAILDAAAATRILLLVRERTISGKRWVEVIRVDDRHQIPDGELAHMFEPHSLLHIVASIAKVAGGESSLATGRTGLELAVELPVAASQSSSSS